MKKIVLILTTLLCCAFASAQKEASNWFFGNNAGISFDIDANTVTATTGALSTEEGCTSISDTNGALLFYTDGRTVYNANNNLMLNGSGLRGDESSTQSALIVPKPNDANTYYIFTVDSAATDGVDTGFNYYEVDMTLDGGLGGVVPNSETQLLANTSEKLSAVLQDCQSENVWVVTFANSGGVSDTNNTFFVYQVTSTGVTSTPITSSSGFTTTESRGYLKFSPDGEKLVIANASSGLILYDFDKTNGTVSFNQSLNINFNSPGGEQQQSYGVEFSPNNNLLYVSTYFSSDGFNNSIGQYGGLLQYNLTAGTTAEVNASQIIIDERQTYRGGLQLGPDGRLYRAMSDSYSDGSPFLSVVENPNQVGLACNYQHNAIALTNDSRQGLPPFITSFFNEDIDIIQNGSSTTELRLCTGDTYTLTAEDIPGATYTWTQDGFPITESDFDLIVTGAGVYNVEIEVNGDACGVIIGEANVFYFDIPIANTARIMEACEDNPEGNITATFDFSTQTTDILGAQDPTVFQVKYYESSINAMSDIDAITANYQNTSTPQTIFARIDNINYKRCFQTTSFEIKVFDTPIISSFNDLESCDNDANPMDGQTETILSNFNADILGSQNAALYTISYHESENDAMNAINNLPNNYTNSTTVTELFIRIENTNNTDCYSTGSINLVINPIPEALDTDIYQCDEQGMVDGFTTFNLTEANAAITGNAPDVSTQFYLTLNDAQMNTNEINGNAFDNTLNPQDINVRITNTLTGCINFSVLTLETSDTEINDYSALPVCDELNSEDGLNTFNLDDFSIDILAGLPAGLNITYYENENDALLENNALSAPYQNTTPYSQIIYVRVENDNACYGINEVLLTVNPLPQLENNDALLYCLNEFPSTLTLDAGLNANAANYSFSWSNSESTETIAINTIGTYTVTVTNNTTSCSKSRTIVVEPSNIASIESIEIIDGSLNNNQIIILTNGEGDYQYALTNQEGNSTSFQDSNVFTQLPPGIYSVNIRDIKNNCGITNQDISVIGFPLYFTPNGDTINDTWQVYGVSNLFQPNSETLIFNRFGKLVAQIKPSGSGWDGTLNGVPLPQNDYWFSVTLQDGRVYKNHFTLKR